MKTEQRIIHLISLQLNIPTERIQPHTHLWEDLNLDDFDRMLLIASLERRLRVFLSPEEVAAINTVQDASKAFLSYAA